MSETLAFIGFGEAGQTISRGLLGEAGPAIRAYDILFDDPANGGVLKRAAQALGVGVARDHADAVRGADLVFLAVTASSSLEAARSCLPGLGAGQLFLDINSVSPQRKIEAAAIKMFRSIVVKGLEAILLESMVASSEYKVEARVLASLQESFPGIDWEKLAGYMIERVVSHAKRRAAEMREVAATLEGIGLEPLMAAASAARQQWIADLGVKERLQGRKTEDRAELVRAIRKAMEVKRPRTGSAASRRQPG
jgi:3-hydroxyisobutyrate dehydrogenase-like beta-hydroxyacid dehydrogenase